MLDANISLYSEFLVDEAATVGLGKRLVASIAQGAVIYLHGDLGAGKTTLTRGIVQSYGHQGKVKSPTYTLVEPYELAEQNIYHFDLYRLADPEELEYMGIRDYFADNSVCLIEWPEKGLGMLAAPDLEITMEYKGDGRQVTLAAKSDKGQKIINSLKQDG